MNFSEKEKNNSKKTILVAPLDWGLGHATRCVPLIRALQDYPVRILLAAEGPVLALLQEEFPHLETLPLRGYRIRYGKGAVSTAVRIGIQLPGILLRAVKEHYWLRKVHRRYNLSAVISDNRFGLFHRQVQSIYISHQLLVKTGHPVTDRLATAFHQWCIRRFSACWVPDTAGADSLAGELSHPVNPPAHTVYIGPLSRLDTRLAGIENIDLLVVLSGPEPQRSLLEEKLIPELKQFNGKAVLVRGLPADPHRPLPGGNNLPAHILVFPHLRASRLQAYMAGAPLVISRSGYTTVMDLVQQGRRSVLVPTPGQAEQEYLAGHLQRQQYCCSLTQDSFSLSAALSAAGQFPYRLPVMDMHAYNNAVKGLVESL
jgi:predicted glycosyltransferase